MEYDVSLIKQNTSFVSSTLQDVKKSHKSAESKFDNAKSEIEHMTANTINVFYDNPHSKIVQVVHATQQASEQLYITCQALVKSLDELCRPKLLDGGISASVVLEVSREINQLNEDSVINIDYTGELDGLSFGDVAKVTFNPSIESRAIETFWKAKAKEFEEIEKSIRKRQEDADYIKKHNIDAKDINTHRVYEEAKRIYENANTSSEVKGAQSKFKSILEYLDSKSFFEKCSQKIAILQEKENKILVEKQRKEKEKADNEARIKKHALDTTNKCYSKVEEYKLGLNKAYDAYIKKIKGEIKEKIAELELQKSELKKYLSQLGIFKGSQKRATKKEIELIAKRIEALRDEKTISNVESELRENIKKAISQYNTTITNYVYKRFPGTKPQPEELDLTNDLNDTEGLKMRILNVLAGKKPMTIQQIIAKDELLEKRGETSVSALIRRFRMEDDDIIRGEVGGKAVFSTDFTKGDVKSMVGVKKQEFDYTEAIKYANEPIPEPPSVSETIPQ